MCSSVIRRPEERALKASELPAAAAAATVVVRRNFLREMAMLF
jgi:hypothetical protein